MTNNEMTVGVVAQTEYLPFGSDRYAFAQIDAMVYKFTDQEEDTDTGLMNYKARFYDPAMGIFISPDPYFVLKVTEKHFYGDKYKYELQKNLKNPQMLNRYAYCLNDPLKYEDGFGLFWGRVAWGFIAFIVDSIKNTLMNETKNIEDGELPEKFKPKKLSTKNVDKKNIESILTDMQRSEVDDTQSSEKSNDAISKNQNNSHSFSPSSENDDGCSVDNGKADSPSSGTLLSIR